MKSALESVAFAHGCEVSGILALLETSLKALDRAGSDLAAAYVDMAITAYAIQASEEAARTFEDISEYQ